MRHPRLGLIVAWGLVLVWSGAWAWQITINGTLNANDSAGAVTVDGGGDVVAAGYTTNTGTGQDFTVVKLSGPSGAELWRYVLNGTANDYALAYAVTVDGGGDVVAAGVTSNTQTGWDFTVVKLSGSSGAELWRYVLNGTANGNDIAYAVTVDGGGDVVAAGYTTNTGTGQDFTVVKLSGPSGAELWRDVLNGAANGNGYALAVTVNAGGEVVAAGVAFTVVKLSGPSGARLWRRVVSGIAISSTAFAVTVDAGGDVVAAGATTTGGFSDFTVAKLSGPSGARLWRRVINGPGNANDEALAVAVDAGGDVVAAGSINNTGTGEDFAVVKLSGSSGAELWRYALNGSANSHDYAWAVAVDAGGDVVAAGFTENSGTGIDFTVVKLSGGGGAELWRRVLNGTANANGDGAFAVAVDARGEVVAAGSINNTGTGEDFAVVKLRGADGGDF